MHGGGGRKGGISATKANEDRTSSILQNQRDINRLGTSIKSRWREGRDEDKRAVLILSKIDQLVLLSRRTATSAKRLLKRFQGAKLRFPFLYEVELLSIKANNSNIMANNKQRSFYVYYSS